MANYESASVYTGNKETFRLLKRHFSKDENHFGFYEADPTRGEIGIRNRHGATLDRLLHLSCLCRDITLYANISYEAERYSRIYKYIVRNGEYATLEVEENVIEEEYIIEEVSAADIIPLEIINDDSPFETISKEEQEALAAFEEILNNHFNKK